MKWSSYKKVPILVVELPDGRCVQLNDSSMITSAMFSFLKDLSRPTESANLPGGLIDVLRCYPKVATSTNKYFLMMFDEKLDKSEMEHLKLERKWRRWVDDDFVHKLR